MSAFEALRPADASLLRETLSTVAAHLIEPLEHGEPDQQLRLEVVDALAEVFTANMRPDSDWEPTERGLAIENLLREFLLKFPT